MMDAYIANHHPLFPFLEPIQTFKNRADLPKELFHLDILDGSPPCSSFSMAGNREDDWGKEKKFREGQSDQILDTLFFDFIDLAKRLQPKVIIAENVKGLLLGEAKGYVNKILQEFDKSGYFVRYDLLDASKMGVPQRRERVFFSAIRKDLYKGVFDDMFCTEPSLKVKFNDTENVYSQIREETGEEEAHKLGNKILHYWKLTEPGNSFSDAHEKGSYFNEIKLHPDKVPPTIRASGLPYDYKEPRTIYKNEVLKIGSFPQDYDFTTNKPGYIIGMSVPPLMTARVAHEIDIQWLSRINK
jgi:DNA (cytosine-5)-methyltransferase 1